MASNLPSTGPVRSASVSAPNGQGGTKDHVPEEDEEKWVISIEGNQDFFTAQTPQANQPKKKSRNFPVSPTVKFYRYHNAKPKESNLSPKGRELARSSHIGTNDNVPEEDEAEWVKKIEKKLEELCTAQTPDDIQPTREFRTFRVSQTVKYKQKLHFQPELIYLGLFNKRFHPTIINRKGEKIKLTLVSAFLKHQRKCEDSSEWQILWKEIRDTIVTTPQAVQQDFYDNDENWERQDATIRCELAVDAISLTSFLSFYLFEAHELVGRNSRYLKLGEIVGKKGLYNHNAVALDVMKLENQIPLWMIGNVLKILYPEAEAKSILNELCRRWIMRLGITLPGFSEKQFERNFGEDYFDFGKDCGHLLDCVSRVMRVDSGNSKAGPSRLMSLTEDLTGCVKTCFRWLVRLPGLCSLQIGRWHMKRSLPKHHHKREKISLPSLSKLRVAGIHVRGDARGTCDLVPQFKPGFLKATLIIPTFSIVHRTEILWNNLVAYQAETVQADEHGKHDQFIYFLKFMDELVDTQEDVFLLRKGGHPVIPKNLLGTEKDVAELFNSITQHYTVQEDPQAAKWVDLRIEIDAFLNQRSRRLALEFMRYNFGKPWFVVSLVAATVLLVLTFLQTLYTMFPYYGVPP